MPFTVRKQRTDVQVHVLGTGTGTDKQAKCSVKDRLRERDICATTVTPRSLHTYSSGWWINSQALLIPMFRVGRAAFEGDVQCLSSRARALSGSILRGSGRSEATSDPEARRANQKLQRDSTHV
jgi:hypothetical protein